MARAAESLGPQTSIGAPIRAFVELDDAPSVAVLLHLRGAAQDVRAAGLRAARAANLCVGVASSSHGAGLAPADLVAVAIEGLALAQAEGGGRAVHSELYDLVQLSSARRRARSIPFEDAPEDWIPRAEAAPIASAPAPTQAPAPAPELRTEAAPVPPAPEPPPALEHEPQPAAPIPTERSSVTEADDPFARPTDSDDVLIPHEAAARLTTSIAPDLATREATSRAELGTLRDEIATLRQERDQLRRSDAQVRGLLERRIAKVTRQLEETEAEVEELRRAQSTDGGVASSFRAVQGLDPTDPAASQKRGMLEGVFESNREPGRGDDGSAG